MPKPKQRRASIGLPAALLALTACNLALAGVPEGPPKDRVRGLAENRFVEFGGHNRLRIRASGEGDQANGWVVGTGNTGAGHFRVEGPVTCIRVEGNRATVKYRYAERSGPGAPPPGGVQVYVADRGNPEGGQPVDANGTDPPTPAPLFGMTKGKCDDPRLRDDLNRVDGGDYRVRDGAS